MSASRKDVTIRPDFGRALSGEFRVRTDSLQRLRSLTELATEAAVDGEYLMWRQPRTKQPAATYGVVLPQAHLYKAEWTPAITIAFTESIGKQCLTGIELFDAANEKSLAIYDATTTDTSKLILVRDGTPWEMPLDEKHFATTQEQITRTSQRFLDQL